MESENHVSEQRELRTPRSIQRSETRRSSSGERRRSHRRERNSSKDIPLNHSRSRSRSFNSRDTSPRYRYRRSRSRVSYQATDRNVTERYRSRSRGEVNNEDLHERLRLLESELYAVKSRNARESGTDRFSDDLHPHGINSANQYGSSNLGDDNVRNLEYKRTDNAQSKFFEEFANFFKRKDRDLFPASNNVVPDYDPLSKEQTISMWLSKVDECADIYGWNDKQTVHYAIPKLVGYAKTWYQGLPSIKHSWIEWKQILQESFPSTENYAELLTEMLNRRARPGESLELYYFSKVNLLNRCKIFGKQAVDCIIYGIEDKGIRLSAQAGKFDKPEETLEFFKTVKTQPREYIELKRDNNFRDRRNQNTVALNSTNYPRSGEYNNTRSKTLNSIICFNCNESGHPSYKCPKPVIKCDLCYFMGHNSNNCPRKTNNSHNKVIGNPGNNNNAQNKTKNVLEVSIGEDSNDKYKIVIKVNGIAVPCQVDLGSQATLIREINAHELGLHWNEVDSPRLRGLGNIPYLPIGRTTARIEVQGVEEEQVEIFVVDNSIINSPVLLGHSFTERPNVKIIKTAIDLQFFRVDVKHDSKIILSVIDDIKLDIGKLQTVLISTSSNYSGGIYIDGSVRGKVGMEYYLLPGEFQISNGKGHVLIQNLSSQILHFERGKLISRVRIISRPHTLDVLGVRAHADDNFNVSNVIIGDHLTTSEKKKCQSLLLKHKDCFSSGLYDLGFTKVAEMEIELLDSTPVVYRPYRLSFAERKNVQGMVAQMLDTGIIRESNSPYASPIVLVQKKSGEKRLCVDYRALNRCTKRDHYPLPRIEDLLDQLSGHFLFTTLDLASGYHQIAIAEGSKEKTAFVTPDGQYEYNRMPFGLANAPAVFQRAIHKVLNKTRVPYVIIYMDDILIPSKTFEEGLSRLEEVLRLLKDAGLTLKLEKCNFFRENIVFLGFEIDKLGIRPGEHKTEAVSKFPQPHNQQDVRRFLGLVGFFRRFVKDFALVAKPLANLLRKDTAWHWGELQQSAFETLKKMLIERPILALYDHSAETQLHTDASKFGLGGILLQRTGQNPWRAVAYYSRQTSIDEQKFHSFELETLAVIAALNKFRPYLLGIKFTIVTDCNALRSTFTKRDLIPRISRWWVQFLEYDCSVEYRPGEKMAHVDALSRGTVIDEQESTHIIDILTVKVDDWISTVQSADSETKRIREILMDPETPKIAAVHKEYQVKNGRVYRVLEDGVLRWLVPKGVRWQVLRSNHDDVGHFGFEKTLQRIKTLFWFPKMRKFIKKYVAACLECAHHKAPSGPKEGALHPIQKVAMPLHTVHADHLGPFTRTKSGNTFILVIVDSFTKYVHLSAVRSTKSKASIKVFKNFFSLFGCPSRLITDRGTSFTSKKFKTFVQSAGIKHILNAVATPRANGQVERYNRTILTSLGSMTHGKDTDSWDVYLPDVQLGINTAVHDVTKQTPMELLFGRSIGNPSQGILNQISDDIREQETRKTIEQIRSEAANRIENNQQKNKTRFDKRRKRAHNYNEGDLVRVIRAIVVAPGKSKKLESKCQGPYRIKKILPNERFLIVDTPITRRGKPYENVVSIDKISPWMNFDAPGCSSGEESD